MLIVYTSLTGNIEKFLIKTNHKEKFKLITGNEIIDNKFILITYTINFGEIPEIIYNFLKNNYPNCIGVIGSGNKNWGSSYCNAIKLINEIWSIPILMDFELSGKNEDVDKFMEIINGI